MRSSLMSVVLLLLAVPAIAGTFEPAELLPEAGIAVLDRAIAREQLQRDLFGDPHASVVLGRVDVYDRFPYVEARYFQIVSDPGWNRLLFGESGQGLAAFDGEGSAFGALDSPHGLAADDQGRVYVADTGNDRIVVFETSSEFDRLELRPAFVVEGLSRPYDVAFSDGGTAFDDRDDRLYVADTGRNRVVRIDLESGAGRITRTLGALGSGEGRFAGPTAIAVGRGDGTNNDFVYVADSHTRRLVRLIDTGADLLWDRELGHQLPQVSDLDTDHWGNVYAASPRTGEIWKFAPDLLPVASLRAGLDHPRSFHVPVLTVTDHVRGTVTRAGQGSGVVVERWGDRSGLRLMDLGVELREIAADASAVHFTLTDRARVHARVRDERGALLREIDLGELDAGRRDADLATLTGGLETSGRGDVSVEFEAVSTYDDARRASGSAHLRLNGDGPAALTEAAVLGASPNPFNPRTSIEFVVPAGPALPASLEIVDARGRVVHRAAERAFDPGRHAFEWTGTDDGGQPVASGVYFYHLRLDGREHGGKLALVK